jgi:hypothetical protein
MTVTAFADSIDPNGSVTEEFAGEATYEYSLTLPSSGNLKIDFQSVINKDDALNYSITGEDFHRVDFIREGNQSYEYELAAGEYTITVKSSYGKYGTFSLTTAFTKATETYKVDNNSVNAIRNTDALAFKKTVYGHLALNDDQDWYKIVLPSSGKLTFSVNSAMDTVYFKMIDKDEKFIREKFIGKGDDKLVYELNKGTYYITFNNRDGGGAYHFKPTFKESGETYQYENETANLVRSKKAIPFATVIKGHFAINDQSDCFKVKIPKTAKYSIKVTSSIDDSIYVNVTNSKDEFVKEYFHRKGTKTYKLELKKGTYYLRFDSDKGGNYSFKVSPSGVSVKKLTKGTKSIKATWYKGTGDGYQLQYSTSSTFASGNKTKLIKSNKTTSTTIKNLNAKKTYYVRIRTYVTGSDGKNIWSAWSKAKSVKTL